MIICNYGIRIIAARVYLCDVQIHFYSNEPFCVNYDQSRQVLRSLFGVLVPLDCLRLAQPRDAGGALAPMSPNLRLRCLAQRERAWQREAQGGDEACVDSGAGWGGRG